MRVPYHWPLQFFVSNSRVSIGHHCTWHFPPPPLQHPRNGNAFKRASFPKSRLRPQKRPQQPGQDYPSPSDASPTKLLTDNSPSPPNLEDFARSIGKPRPYH